MLKSDKELILVSLSATDSFWGRFIFGYFFIRHNTPAALLILAALTPPEYKISFRNQVVFWPRRDFRPGVLVGITCLTSSAPEAYGLARKFRAAGAQVIMGGPHVSALPEEALLHCDSVVIGEAEPVWGAVIADHEKGTLQKIYQGYPVDDFLTPVYSYLSRIDPRLLQMMTLMFSRGCKYRCDFCVQKNVKIRTADMEKILALVERYKSLRSPAPIHFGDMDIFADPPRAKEFFRRLIPLKIKWFGHTTIDIAFDEEALKLARQSGCYGLQIGIETLHFEAYSKNHTRPIKTTDDYVRALRAIQSRGIPVVAAFIVGLDQDTHRDYWGLLGFFIRTFFQCRLMWICTAVLVPYPGTALYERLKREGRLVTSDWRRYLSPVNVVFRPRNMSRWAAQVWYFAIRTFSFPLSNLGLIFMALIVTTVGGTYWLFTSFAHAGSTGMPAAEMIRGFLSGLGVN